MVSDASVYGLLGNCLSDIRERSNSSGMIAVVHNSREFVCTDRESAHTLFAVLKKHALIDNVFKNVNLESCYASGVGVRSSDEDGAEVIGFVSVLADSIKPISENIWSLLNATARTIESTLTAQKKKRVQNEKQEVVNDLHAELILAKTQFQRMPTMAHSIDTSGRIIMVSDRWLQTLGYRRDEVIGRFLTEFLSVASVKVAARALPTFFKRGFINDVLYEMVSRNGDVVEVLLSGVLIYNADGTPLRSIATLQNLTVLRPALRLLDQSTEL